MTPSLPLLPWEVKKWLWGPAWSRLRLPQLYDPKVPAHLAVQHDHVLRVSTEPRLHGFADGTQFVQRRGMQLRPAKVLHLGKYKGTTVCEGEQEQGGEGWNVKQQLWGKVGLVSSPQ